MGQGKAKKGYIDVTVYKREYETKTTYHYSYYDWNGNRKRGKLSNDKDVAKAKAREMERKLNKAPFDSNPLEYETISLKGLKEEFLAWKKNDVKEKTLTRYENLLDPFQDFMYEHFPDSCDDVRLINELYVKEYRDICVDEELFSRRTINHSLNTISSMFKRGMERGYLDNNPTDKVKQLTIQENDTVKYFEKEELKKIWDELDDHWVDFFQFIYLMGLRKGEAINLQWDSVHLDEKNPYIKIEKNDEWSPKTQSSIRVLQLNDQALDIIKRQKGNHEKYVFVNKKGRKVPNNTCYGVLKRCLKRLNMLDKDGEDGKEQVVHKLRHTFASHLVMNEVDLYTLKELLGHSSIEMVQKYAHLSPDHTRKALDKIST